ncbi:redox-sensing transcriptional repressor Rex [Eubacterium xylanophilum]|uniref:redox-sensing transcriptional repressor Rex n=1 Tax=Eubacterium xylanophilum TaxID=39497 RepID=UPI00047BAA70|nr:redox-sensing transcriptional repressor Rex [Eubacterium xylanophilum]
MENKKISMAVVRRLPRYYRYLSEILDGGTERISSQELSKRMNVTASQIRQDFNNFGGFGQQGYGYNVRYLRDEIGKILGLDIMHNVIIVGAGNLGQALANYGGFNKRGFHIAGIFDVDQRIIGNDINNLRVRSISEIEDFLQKEHIDIAALTLPRENASLMAKKLADLGIGAFWNFAPTDLKLPNNVVVENVHLAESLMRLSYRLSEQN